MKPICPRTNAPVLREVCWWHIRERDQECKKIECAFFSRETFQRSNPSVEQFRHTVEHHKGAMED